MKFIKLTRKYMDAEDNVYDIGSILEVSDDIADELVEAKKAEASDGIIKEVKAEEKTEEDVDVKKEIKEAVSDAMKDVKVEEKSISKVEVVEDAPVWKSEMDFMEAVIKAGKGNQTDERLYKQTGQSEAVNADGGFLVERRIIDSISEQTAQAAVLAPKCSKMEVGDKANGIKIPQVNETTRSATTLFGGVRLYSPAEGIAKTAFKQAYAQVDVPLGKLAAVNYVTDELLQDRTALRSFIGANVGKAFAWVIDQDILTSATCTQIIGIQNHAATVQVAVAGANPTRAELNNMYVAQINKSRAEWYMSNSQFSALLNLEDGGSTAIYQPNYNVSPSGTLLGRPINVIEQADVDANDTSIMFLDLSDYLIIAKGGINEAVSMHVKFLEDEMCFRWVQRIAGSPLQASTITLPDGTIVSSFVTRD